MNPRKGKGRGDDAVVNMSPSGDVPPAQSDLGPPPRPNNITDTKAWNASRQGMGRALSNYRELLRVAFRRLSRYQQEELIGRFCMVITIGVTILVTLMFYSLIHRALRIIIVPGAIFAAWWVAKAVVKPVIIARFEPMLNPPGSDNSDTPIS